MFKPGRKMKQFFQFFSTNHIQIFKKMTKDYFACGYQLKIEYSICKALIFNFSILVFDVFIYPVSYC